VLVRDGRGDRPGGRVEHADPAAQAVALERQAVARQPQVPELGRQLHERPHLGLILEPGVMQRDLGAGVRQRRIRIGGDQQEDLGADPARPHPGNVGEQLIAADAQRADDARRQGMALEIPRLRCHGREP
jgi:hypothetical protein